MPRFFVSKADIIDGVVTIKGEDAHHIARSLRMAAGEHITVCDMQKTEYDCVLERFDGDKAVYASVLSQQPLHTEPPVFITLYQALPKADKFDTIIQKAVECGVSRIVPFESEYCVVKMRADAEDRKQQRRDRIALEAAKQCGRGILPAVERTLSFSEAIAEAKKADVVLFCYEAEDTTSLKNYLQQRRQSLFPSKQPLTVSVVIGSEGGFSEREVEYAKLQGCVPVGLGPRILRTETASCFVLGCLIYEFEL